MGQTKCKHYAVFPPTLCERPIAMTCPMRVCKICGHFRTRIYQMQEYIEQRGVKRIFGKYSSSPENIAEVSGRVDSGKSYIPKKPVTIGWSECEHKEWTSGIVLDIFCGSGTTGEVALNMGRDFIGIDLYPNYIEMTNERCRETLIKMSKLNLSPYNLEK
jgi:2-polyprenyl-3-methyl-5-hydroxy-6-metoxy-1,4-benzoquinol methylase